jgi:hypothetical protein
VARHDHDLVENRFLLPGSSNDFGKLIAAETEKLGKVIRAANIRAD